jgi:hypothetical protein
MELAPTEQTELLLRDIHRCLYKKIDDSAPHEGRRHCLKAAKLLKQLLVLIY